MLIHCVCSVLDKNVKTLTVKNIYLSSYSFKYGILKRQFKMIDICAGFNFLILTERIASIYYKSAIKQVIQSNLK